MKKYILLFFLFLLAVNLSFASERHGDIVRRSATRIVGFTSDCDYVCDGTNDHVQIQNALNSLSGGGTLVLREGIYDIQASFQTAYTSTTVTGQGRATELQFNASYIYFEILHEYCRVTNLHMNITTGPSDFRISESNFMMDNIWVTLGVASSYIRTGIGKSNIILSNMQVISKHPAAFGIRVFSDNFVLSNSSFENQAEATDESIAILIQNSINRAIISDCVIKGGFISIINSTGVVIQSNSILGEDSIESGIKLSSSNADCIIANNYISSCSIAGIGYNSGTSKDFIITGNRIENCLTGIKLDNNLSRFQIQGNNFQGCGSETTGSATDLRMRLNIDKDGNWLTDDLVTTLETVSELFLTDENAISSQYKLLVSTVPTGAQSTLSATITTTDVIVASFTTNSPLGITTFPEGVWDLHFHGYKSATTKVLRTYFTVTKSTGSGETVLFSSEESNPLTASSESYIIHVATNEIVITTGDYITLRVYASVTGAGVNPTFTLEMEGTTATRLQFPALLPEVSVTKIIAGTNVTITPTSGKGEVKINSTAVGYTTYYVLLGGAMQDIYKSTGVPIDGIPVPSSWTITGARAFTTYCSTNSVIFEIKETTGCYTPIWTSIARVELSSNTAQSQWVALSTNLDENKRIGLFVNFVPAIGVDSPVGAGVLVRYHRKE